MPIQIKYSEIFGKKIGYLSAYLLFTTILYTLLNLFKKIPESWTYFHIAGITVIISFVGFLLDWRLR